jgi:hypothetical protein
VPPKELNCCKITDAELRLFVTKEDIKMLKKENITNIANLWWNYEVR